MTADDNTNPSDVGKRDPAQAAAKVREDLGEAADATKADLKERAKVKAAQTKDAVTEQTDHAVRAAQHTVAQAKDRVSGLASRAREASPSAEPSPAARRAGV